MRSADLAAALVAGVAAMALAGEGPHLAATVPTSAVTVGDRVTAEVAAVGDASALWGELSVAPDETWAVAVEPSRVVGADPPAWRVVLTPLKVGELALPAMSVTVRRDGDPVPAVLSEPPTVTVASVLPPGDEVEPAALRPPIGARGLPWEWFVPGLVAAIPLMVAAAWLWRRRGARPAPLSAKLGPLEELEALAARLAGRVGHEPSPVLCDELAAGLRAYLERRTGEPAREMTSFELRLLARRAAWPDAVQRGVHGVMAVADGVRFGRRQAPALELDRAITSAVEVARELENHLRPAAEAAS